MTKTTTILLAALLLAGLASASDWPQWLGPERNGVSEESDLPVKWSHEENVAWRLEMPERSGSTPIVSGDTIFLNVASGDDLGLWAVAADTGEVRWKRPLGGGNELMRKHNMSSPSPVTDGKWVWVMTGTGELEAFDFAGEKQWGRNIQEDYGAFGLNWGYGASPLLYDGDLFIPVLHGMKTDDPSYVLRVDGASGETLWRVERPTDAIKESPDSYSTPAVWTRDDRSELIISGGDYVTGHDLDTGKEIWRVGGLNPENAPFYRIVASPLPVGDYLVVPSRVKPLVVLRSTGATTPEVAWSIEKGTDVPTPVAADGILYVVDDQGIGRAFELETGKLLWGPQRLAIGTYSASPIIAAGHLYVTSEDGITNVVATGREFDPLQRNQVKGYTLSTIAVADGRLYLRTAEYLYAIGD